MKLFSKIRSSSGEKKLSRKVKTLVRQKQVHNFETANTAGILFDAGNPDEVRLIKEFSKFLAANQIESTLIGYSDTDEIGNDLLFRDNIIIFCKKDLDFFFRPAHDDAIKFISKKFDILFDLSLTDYFPLRYIANLSPSAFKVGKFSPNTSFLDLMIDIHSRPSLEFLIGQIKNYVIILNNPKAQFLK